MKRISASLIWREISKSNQPGVKAGLEAVHGSRSPYQEMAGTRMESLKDLGPRQT